MQATSRISRYPYKTNNALIFHSRGFRVLQGALNAKCGWLGNLRLSGGPGGRGTVDEPRRRDKGDCRGKGPFKSVTANVMSKQWCFPGCRLALSAAAFCHSFQGMEHIEGDQVTNCTFYFAHPLLERCDREVAFVCAEGEWRAEG